MNVLRLTNYLIKKKYRYYKVKNFFNKNFIAIKLFYVLIVYLHLQHLCIQCTPPTTYDIFTYIVAKFWL